MNEKEIKQKILENIKTKRIKIIRNNSNFYIEIVSNQFENVSLIERHKLIYEILKQYIENKSIHALSIETLTYKEWEDIKN